MSFSYCTIQMSALSSLCEYDSEESDCDTKSTKNKKLKLRLPDLSAVPVIPTENYTDNCDLHAGRLRSFPHVRGNWSSFVYIQYTEDEDFLKLFKKLQAKVFEIDGSCYKCDDFHISLSKTVVLQYHLITSFSTTLQKILSDFESFKLSYDSVKIYCNEENTRTFVALEVDHFSKKYLMHMTDKIDNVLKEYNLPTFYENPSFHMSILWLNGNKKAQLINILDNLNDILLNKNLKTIHINKVNCKVGNKYFQYFLL
ncbi:U6 snRNA phosphodiesterase 1 [Achroia grisella]|uniref:U6 snRNA phosphodiesterase 1 n=1 Tax=Achroia grisella TaxID=688607 RepID=UPI0027D2C149|nr:U6 snRNA phosphodiesterase 1 [Achroia grisella]